MSCQELCWWLSTLGCTWPGGPSLVPSHPGRVLQLIKAAGLLKSSRGTSGCLYPCQGQIDMWCGDVQCNGLNSGSSSSSNSSSAGWAAGFSLVTKANEHRCIICTGTILLWPHQDRSYLYTWKQLCGFPPPSFSSASMVLFFWLEPPPKVCVTNIYIL